MLYSPQRNFAMSSSSPAMNSSAGTAETSRATSSRYDLFLCNAHVFCPMVLQLQQRRACHQPLPPQITEGGRGRHARRRNIPKRRRGIRRKRKKKNILPGSLPDCGGSFFQCPTKRFPIILPPLLPQFRRNPPPSLRGSPSWNTC